MSELLEYLAAHPEAEPPARSLPEWLTPAQAARHLQVSERWLQRHRTAGTGPRFSRSGQVVRYRREDLDTWMLDA